MFEFGHGFDTAIDVGLGAIEELMKGPELVRLHVFELGPAVVIRTYGDHLGNVRDSTNCFEVTWDFENAVLFLPNIFLELQVF